MPSELKKRVLDKDDLQTHMQAIKYAKKHLTFERSELLARQVEKRYSASLRQEPVRSARQLSAAVRDATKQLTAAIQSDNPTQQGPASITQAVQAAASQLAAAVQACTTAMQLRYFDIENRITEIANKLQQRS